MSLLAKEELLAHQWHIVGIHQVAFMWILVIASIGIGLIGTYYISYHIFKSSETTAVDMSITSCLCCFLATSFYLIWCGCLFQPSLSPTTVARQNVKTIEIEHKLPKLEHLENHYNNEYMYHAHREDDNLKKHQVTIYYRKLFYKTKNNIGIKKDFLSYRNRLYLAKTKHGGFHYVRSPRTSDTFMPRHYSFQMNHHEYDKESE